MVAVVVVVVVETAGRSVRRAQEGTAINLPNCCAACPSRLHREHVSVAANCSMVLAAAVGGKKNTNIKWLPAMHRPEVGGYKTPYLNSSKPAEADGGEERERCAAIFALYRKQFGFRHDASPVHIPGTAKAHFLEQIPGHLGKNNRS